MSEEVWIIHASYLQWLRTCPPEIEEALFWWSIEQMREELEREIGQMIKLCPEIDEDGITCGQPLPCCDYQKFNNGVPVDTYAKCDLEEAALADIEKYQKEHDDALHAEIWAAIANENHQREIEEGGAPK